jgi:hypothetical protein
MLSWGIRDTSGSQWSWGQPRTTPEEVSDLKLLLQSSLSTSSSCQKEVGPRSRQQDLHRHIQAVPALQSAGKASGCNPDPAFHPLWRQVSTLSPLVLSSVLGLLLQGEPEAG